MNQRTPIISVILLFLSAIITPPDTAFAAVPVSLSASSFAAYDLSSNRLLYSRTPHEKRAPASTTKVLTAIVVMDLLPMDKVITIPQFAEQIQPSKAYLKAGERYYVRDLLKATLMNSANDAAEVLAVAAAGSKTAFADAMNRKAKSIGCKHSNFIRASGLPAKNQYSTALDLALIMKHAQNYPFIVSTLKTKTGTMHSLDGRKIYLKNHNKMLWRDSREVVGKTGWTRRAKHCFVGHINAPGKKIVFAILGSSSLWRDVKRMVDYHFGQSVSRIQTNKRILARNEIEQVQTALQKAGLDPGPIDGQFGPKTLRAVMQFQKNQGLSPDGIVGTKTWNKLRSYL